MDNKVDSDICLSLRARAVTKEKHGSRKIWSSRGTTSKQNFDISVSRKTFLANSQI